jgi:hypothetical protein
MTEFRTDAIFEALQKPLALIDNPERRQQIEAYIEAARVSLERSVFDLLSKFADTVNGEIAAHYEVALGYRPGVLDLDVRRREPSEPTEETWSAADGEVEKITIRIPAELKELATESAIRAGLSANSWFVRALARALREAEPKEPPEDAHRRGRHHEERHGPGQRLSGWVGPDES